MLPEKNKKPRLLGLLKPLQKTQDGHLALLGGLRVDLVAARRNELKLRRRNPGLQVLHGLDGDHGTVCGCEDEHGRPNIAEVGARVQFAQELGIASQALAVTRGNFVEPPLFVGRVGAGEGPRRGGQALSPASRPELTAGFRPRWEAEGEEPLGDLGQISRRGADDDGADAIRVGGGKDLGQHAAGGLA